MKKQKYSRRDFIKMSSLATTGLYSAGISGLSLFDQKKLKIGMQLYCVRKECAVDFAATLKQVAQAGFQGVEFADYFNFRASEIRKMLDDNGLEVCGTHIYKETLLGDELQKTIEFNKTLGNKYLIVRSFPEELRQNSAAWYKLAEQLDEITKELKPYDMRVGYHNHDYEFHKLDNGEIAWDILADNTSKDVILQLDTCNCSQAGVNPLDYLKRNPGRTVTSHLKPYSQKKPKAYIGDDDINWKQALQLYEKISGIEWYIMEYEQEVENMTPLQSLKINKENLLKIMTS
jgi:sugar phosphate isomerase/epimerase